MIQNKQNKELERKIDLYVNGMLAQDEIDELWAELIQDDYYLDYMKSVANLKAIIKESRSNKRTSPAITLRKYASYVAAAVVLIVAGMFGAINYSTSTNNQFTPINEIGLDVVRSESGVSGNVSSEVVKQAIKLAADGNIEEAKSILEFELNVTKDATTVADLSLTLGSIQYNSGEYNSAVNSFETVTQQNEIENSTLEKGYWFLGNTYFQLDELEKAKLAFQSAYELDGAYSRVAKSYINALSAMED